MLRAEEVRPQNSDEGSDWSADQQAAIQAEADLILAHPVFKNSKRCVTLFRRLVRLALDGDLVGVKERTLGIEAFGRDAGYDTNNDPIVRMTANEIRKRLAQYYQVSTDHHALRIRLVPGTYLPQFDFEPMEQASDGGNGERLEDPPQLGPVVLPALPDPPEISAATRWRWAPYGAAILLAVAVGVALAYSSFFRSTQYRIWAPILDSKEPVTVCVAYIDPTEITDGKQAEWAQLTAKIIETRNFSQDPPHSAGLPSVPFVDVDAASRLTGWMSAHHKNSRVRPYSALTLEDLRRGPTILVGAFDNPWSLVLLSNLRYRFRVDPVTQDEWIEDAQNPSQRSWTGSGKLFYSDTSVDYAIVTRVLAPETGKWVLAAGGLGMHGTEAAGELLTDPALDTSLPSILRTGKNFQIVLRTTVIGGHTGTPEIVAIHTW